ncbi:hypothetical protein NDU88_001350 [Pleurodeles waltl]|uniref:Uncharacterized protein n=1 Tax=Pleurodeles waltl TaxID=8319 RepID=A0AAV7VZ56_PLEWA|nr:hypothetical protein NDU88_001350 [Pleurodeles waltl]
MSMDSGAEIRARKMVSRLLRRGGALSPGGRGAQEMGSASIPRCMGQTTGKVVPRKESLKVAQGCKGDDMELDYFEDSSEEGQIIDGDSDTEGAQVGAWGGANVLCPSTLKAKMKHRQATTRRTAARKEARRQASVRAVTLMPGHTKVTHYLDDFFFITPSISTGCQELLDSFTELMEDVGMPLAPEKTAGPSNSLSFMRIELDSMTREARLPLDKQVTMLLLLDVMLEKPKVTVKEVQTVLGQLNFVFGVVRVGRTCCRWLGRALLGLSMPHHHVRVSVGVREDLHMWCFFLDTFNGIPMGSPPEVEWEAQIFSDAAGYIVFGIYYQGIWCTQEWPARWKRGGRGIAFLELFPLLVAVYKCSPLLQHKKVLGHKIGIQDGGRISRLIATTALAHPQTTRGSRSPAAADAADAVRRQHGPLQALFGFLVVPARIGAATAGTGGPRKNMRA